LLLFPVISSAQTKPEPKPEPSGEAQDVIKFETSLVQTDVMVFDKQGRFVSGLKPEQFQLKINKTPREISFFENITSGGATTTRDESTDANATATTKPSQIKLDAQRRSVIFFVDDLHLAPDSLSRT